MRLTEFLQETKSDDVNDMSLMEQRLIEDRNILNVDEITSWADGESGDLALRLTHEKSIQQSVYKWLSKALRKYILTTSRGSEATVDPHGNVYASGGLNAILDDLPQWAQQAVASGKKLTYINPRIKTIAQDVPKEVRLVADWLKHKVATTPEQLTPNRLSRISFENALSLSDDYHEELIRKRPATQEEVGEWYLAYMYREMQEPWVSIKQDKKKLNKVYKQFTETTGRKVSGVEDAPEGHVLVKEYNNGSKWIKLTTQDCLNYEGTQMGHCVADYGHEVSSGYTEIISLRDKNNNPHITIEFEAENTSVQQIKGKENEPPVAKYIPYVIDMLNDLYDKHGILKYANEAELDLTKMEMIEDESTNTIKMVMPPFESSSFGYSIKYKNLDSPKEESWETASEGTSNLMGAIEGTLDDYEYLKDIQSGDIEYVLTSIIESGEWQDENGDEYQGVLKTIWYDGPDKDVKRELKQVVPKT